MSQEVKDRLERQRLLNEWAASWTEKRHKNVCKPCWEINYCPYGPLVEQFPLPMTRKDVADMKQSLIEDMAKKPMKGKERKDYQQMMDDIKLEDYPLHLPPSVIEKECSIFGHICPVFFISEPFTETNRLRKVSRHIPRNVMIRVVRRDNSSCQVCSRHLLDNQIEFDHIIPVTKGGVSEESNVRVIYSDCNKVKSNKVTFGSQAK